MDSIKTANILLIVILVILLATNVWSFLFVKDVADAKAGKNDPNAKGFLGTKTLARNLVK